MADPFVVGQLYRVRYHKDRKPWTKPTSNPGRGVFIGEYRGRSPDGERHVFLVSKRASQGVTDAALISWEDVEHWRKSEDTKGKDSA